MLTNDDQNREKILEGRDQPCGFALWKDYLYIGDTTSGKRYKYDARRRLPAGEKLYVGIGSASNVPPASPARSNHRFNRYTSGHEIVAASTRDSIGLQWHPNSTAAPTDAAERHDELMAAVEERNLFGDDSRLVHSHPAGQFLRLALRLRRSATRIRVTMGRNRTGWPRRPPAMS